MDGWSEFGNRLGGCRPAHAPTVLGREWAPERLSIQKPGGVWGVHMGATLEDPQMTHFSKEYDKKLNRLPVLSASPGQLPSKPFPHHDALELSKQLTQRDQVAEAEQLLPKLFCHQAIGQQRRDASCLMVRFRPQAPLDHLAHPAPSCSCQLSAPATAES